MVMNTLPRLWRRLYPLFGGVDPPGVGAARTALKRTLGLVSPFPPRHWRGSLAKATSASEFLAALVTWLPAASMAVAFGLYGLASAEYPGPEWGEPGYDHFSQYWCELTREMSPRGHVNLGRDYAQVATWLLPVSLVPLWFKVPALMSGCGWRTRIVPSLGTVAMASLALVGTGLHDQALHLGAVLGTCAMGAVLTSIDGSRHRLVASAAWLAAGLAFLNYLLWSTASYPAATALSQKTALLAAAAWVVVTCSAIRGVEQANSRA